MRKRLRRGLLLTRKSSVYRAVNRAKLSFEIFLFRSIDNYLYKRRNKMTQSPTPIHETVREHYADRIKNSASCCGSDACCSVESSLYPEQLLNTIPTDIASTSYGCGDPITLASLQPGQTVLDLGSGAGLDCLLAAQKVGPEGRVIGVDMTPEMITRARANAKKINLTNVEFRQG